MGDRGNIKVVDDTGEGAIYLYTHWGGSEVKTIAANALARGRDRWDDPAYLAGIIFCEMVPEKMFQDATTLGMRVGISTYVCDNEHPIVVVDHKRQEVHFESQKGNSVALPHAEVYTFEDFIQKFATITEGETA